MPSARIVKAPRAIRVIMPGEQRIGIRSPTVRYVILARHGEVFYGIRTPFVCQVKAFDGRSPLACAWTHIPRQ